jgi:fluoride ion exporter CrcB/FEX
VCFSLPFTPLTILSVLLLQDGSYCELGPQVLSALFGYIMGLIGAIACFYFGRSVATWVSDLKNPNNHDTNIPPPSEDEEEPPMQPIDAPNNNDTSYPTTLAQQQQQQQQAPYQDSGCCQSSVVRAIPFVLVFVVLLLFIAGYVLEGIHFYRTMIAKSMIAPIGALLRWKLSGLNSRPEGGKLSWLPVGTLAANLIASVVSIVCIVFADRFHNEEDLWVDAILFSMRVGFAGCLSTVSSMVKEIVNLSEKYPGQAKSYLYGFGTLLVAICTCLPLYSIIGRVGL